MGSDTRYHTKHYAHIIQLEPLIAKPRLVEKKSHVYYRPSQSKVKVFPTQTPIFRASKGADEGTGG